MRRTGGAAGPQPPDREERVINYSAPISVSHLPRENFGTWEFPVLHVRGGTSTGLVIWDRVAPKQLELREELLRHLMGLPLTGTSSDSKQITGLGRGYATSNKVFFAEMATDRQRRSAHRLDAGATGERQIADRLERQLRQHVGGAALLGDRSALPAARIERRGRSRDFQYQYQEPP